MKSENDKNGQTQNYLTHFIIEEHQNDEDISDNKNDKNKLQADNFTRFADAGSILISAISSIGKCEVGYFIFKSFILKY